MNQASQVLCSSRILHSHMQSQITKMKYQRGKFEKQMESDANIEIIFNKIIQSFHTSITNSNLSVNIQNNSKQYKEKRVKIISDWNLYQLIVFNVIQNAIKYNTINGKVDINLSFEEKQNQLYLNTLISDTGIGIDQHRQ